MVVVRSRAGGLTYLKSFLWVKSLRVDPQASVHGIKQKGAQYVTDISNRLNSLRAVFLQIPHVLNPRFARFPCSCPLIN